MTRDEAISRARAAIEIARSCKNTPAEYECHLVACVAEAIESSYKLGEEDQFSKFYPDF
jgi:hypothetical protein